MDFYDYNLFNLIFLHLLNLRKQTILCFPSTFESIFFEKSYIQFLSQHLQFLLFLIVFIFLFYNLCLHHLDFYLLTLKWVCASHLPIEDEEEEKKEEN